jgi:hypothetical protein
LAGFGVITEDRDQTMKKRLARAIASRLKRSLDTLAKRFRPQRGSEIKKQIEELRRWKTEADRQPGSYGDQVSRSSDSAISSICQDRLSAAHSSAFHRSKITSLKTKVD